MTRFLVRCAVLHCFGLNPGAHTSLCHKIGLSGSRRTTSVLGLDLSTEIDPIFDFIVGVALYKAYL